MIHIRGNNNKRELAGGGGRASKMSGGASLYLHNLPKHLQAMVDLLVPEDRQVVEYLMLSRHRRYEDEEEKSRGPKKKMRKKNSRED